MRLDQALAEARRALSEIEGGARDARWLVAAALDVPRDRLTLRGDCEVAPDELRTLERFVARRAAREPVSHIIGARDFYGRSFKVTPDVLDPRPETETLVAAALERPFRRVLDLGTGSSAILATLLAEREEATGQGTDISPAALSVARENASRLGVADRVSFAQSDWFARVDGDFDLIVSNPPYIPHADMAALSPELSHEPDIALTDGGDGLSAYRAIFAGAGPHLSPKGRICVEFGAGQGPDIAAIAQAACWANTSFRCDLDGRPRVLVVETS